MTQLLDRPPGIPLPYRPDGARTSITCHAGPPYVSVRQPVVAVVTADGATCRDIVLELGLTRLELERQREIEKQLTRALISRDSLGQAKGILMERYKISADAAFAVLERESGRSNRKLVDVAECLLFSGETGGHQADGG